MTIQTPVSLGCIYCPHYSNLKVEFRKHRARPIHHMVRHRGGIKCWDHRRPPCALLVPYFDSLQVHVVGGCLPCLIVIIFLEV